MNVFDADKTRMIGLPYGEKKTMTIMLKPFSSNLGTSRTDGYTDRRTLSRISVLMRDNKAEVQSGIGCNERGVTYLRKLLFNFKSNKKKYSFRRVESKKIGSHPGRDLL